jgi:hypothetical protein
VLPLQVLSKLKDATTRGHFGDDLDTLGNPAVVKNHIETLKDQVHSFESLEVAKNNY